MDVLAGEVVGVFAHVERADENRAGRFHPLDQRGVALGRREIAVDLRAGARRQARDVKEVLHREGHAGERADLLAGGNVGGGQIWLGGHGSANTGAGSVSSGSAKSSTKRASRNETSRLARMAGLQASSMGNASAFATASI